MCGCMYVCILITDRHMGCTSPYLVRRVSPAVRDEHREVGSDQHGSESVH